jgi:aryl-alcohol dehydrogenase-like predicted oxidoreductase
MKLRNLGKTGLQVSLAGLGCNNFGGRIDEEATRAVIFKCLDVGITFFDTADVYGGSLSETLIGKILGPHRKSVVLATKFGMLMDRDGTLKGASRRYIMTAVEASLKRLETDWIDLYQLHRPDPLTPIEETLRALDDLVHQGKVRYLGNSNFAGWQAVEAEYISRQLGIESFVTCQNDYSLLNRAIESELVPAMSAYELGLLPYFPLANGLLTGKYKRNQPLPEGTRLARNPAMLERVGLDDAKWQIIEALDAFATARGHSLLDLAFAWLAAQPFVSSVIAGATKPEQVAQNAAAVDWVLTPAELEEIDRIAPGPV